MANNNTGRYPGQKAKFTENAQQVAAPGIVGIAPASVQQGGGNNAQSPQAGGNENNNAQQGGSGRHYVRRAGAALKRVNNAPHFLKGSGHFASPLVRWNCGILALVMGSFSAYLTMRHLNFNEQWVSVLIAVIFSGVQLSVWYFKSSPLMVLALSLSCISIRWNVLGLYSFSSDKVITVEQAIILGVLGVAIDLLPEPMARIAASGRLVD